MSTSSKHTPVAVGDLVGMTLVSVTRSKSTPQYVWKGTDEALCFVTDCGVRFEMYHSQDCCESVTIEDICGDLEDLVGSPITLAEEVSNPPIPAGHKPNGSETWTFYRLATAKGLVTIRWYGVSNGYYSESVDFYRVEPKVTEIN